MVKKTKKTVKVTKVPPYKDRILHAISGLKDRTGSSAIAIEAFIVANYRKHPYERWRMRLALKKLLADGTVKRHHQHRNSYKIARK